jgi:hypothetical protein
MKREYLIFFLLLICTESFCQVKFVIEFFRNAISSPSTLNDDKYDILGEKWIQAKVVTLKGIKEQYEIGAKLRKHYVKRLNFLSENFTESEVKVLSVDVNKNILTTNAQLMGMWPAPNGPSLNQDSMKYAVSSFDLYNSEDVYQKLGFSPLPGGAPVFPIKTFAPDNNYFELAEENNCKGISKIYELNKHKPVVLKFMKSFKERYTAHFKKYLNITDNYFDTHKNLKQFCSAYIAGQNDLRDFKKLNLSEKGSVNRTGLLKDCREYKSLVLFEIKLGDEKGEIIRLITSNFVTKLFEHLDKVILAERSQSPHLKMLMLSADYNDISSLLLYIKLAFGHINVPYPKYSSVSIFELVKNKNAPKFNATEENYTVNVFFNDKVLTSINYSLFKRNLLMLTMDINAISDFCGFTDYTSLYFKLAALLLFFAFVAIGFYILNLWRKLHSQESAIYKKNEGEVNLNNKLISNEEVH